MDEELGDEVAPIDMTEGAHLQNKESDYSLKPEGCNMMQSHREMAIPESHSPDSSFQILADMLEGKNINRIVGPVDDSEQPCTSPHNVDEAGVMVEELTVRQYDSSNLAIVGTSNNRGKMQTRLNRWQHLYNLGSGSGSGSSRGDRDNGPTMLGGLENVGYTSFPELTQKRLNDDQNVVIERSANAENNGVSGNILSHGSIRTKIISKSGFSEFFVKNTLKGKGIVCRGPPHDTLKEFRDLSDPKIAVGTTVSSNASPKAAGAIIAPSNVPPKAAGGTTMSSNASLSSGVKIDVASSYRFGGLRPGSSDHGVSLRAWLKGRSHKVNKSESLYIFRQIVDLVDCSHTQGVTLLDLRPSTFKLLQSNQVKYLGSTNQKEMLERVTDQDIPHSENILIRRRPAEKEVFPLGDISAKKQKFNKSTSFVGQWPLLPLRSGINIGTVNASDINIAGAQYSLNDTNEHHSSKGYGTQNKSVSFLLPHKTQQQSTSIFEQLEEKWYASPEELSEGTSTISSNIYSLGVLLFELLGCFDSERRHAAAMSDLRQRILPPNFLSENPKEAGFCLWLLHPETLSRPTTREILQSEVIHGLQEVCAEELSSSIDQDDAESELLMHFLSSLEEQKKNHASKLLEDVRLLEADIEEVERRHCSRYPLLQSCLRNDSINARENKYLNNQPSSSEGHLPPISDANEMKLMRNMSQLERAYFSMRSIIQLSGNDATTRPDKDLLRNRENWCSAQNDDELQNPTDPLGAFFDGLCKYARYSKFEVRGMLRTGDFNNSANVICSLSFDRDEDHFAAAGVSKKIKIFEFNALFNDSVDIHYPAVEMSNRSKLSCICWNNYIKNYLASADYDGVVKLWDASTGQVVSHYIEHEKRAWSVDFSQVHPTKLASGSDDCSVKLWNINEATFFVPKVYSVSFFFFFPQRNCLGTIRNIANVCCVQFSAHSSHLLAFGSADYRTYCYDLRNTRAPWCVLAGHDKAVSYVKFLDSETLVTTSTDNTLKLWDLKKTNYGGPSTSACSLTFSGHTNEKNFVGLSTTDGYIACGSETNEVEHKILLFILVYAYHRSLPMPITSHKFGSIDSITGKETDDDNGLFVSSVCWRRKSDMVIAANSSGCIKVLQMV
ncbi:hypothetical protein EZV62_023155 [Acer yangbiense]|uniref:Protein kinase domain-containing protein n=1 Tax=Acer yangbiense TaxID=1000413 RepID=A0A5C7H1C0_9ROSI|nr:hypothetical protein EZV62_023155 [Acer yangbiense]